MPNLYILPFDHRGSFQKMMLGHKNPLTDEEREKLKYYKGVIFKGFKKVLDERGAEDLGILVDEEFGTAIHEEALELGVRNALSTEKSGQKVYDFEYENWRDHVEAINPVYVKALIRMTVGEDNIVQNERLREISEYCEEEGFLFLLEPLIQASEEDLAAVGGDKHRFDAEVRPHKFAEAAAELHSAGVFPDVWKIEGTETKEGMDICSDAVFDGGKPDAEIVILGRGESDEKVEQWLAVSAKCKGVTGFAVGRTIFAQALEDLAEGKKTEDEAATEIGAKFEHFIQVFEKAQNA